MFSRDTLHLWILGGALVLAGVGFFTVRSLVVPPSFGQYGHYRGAALPYETDKPRNLTTRGDCLACHDPLKHPMGKSHERVHCIECHGEGEKHMEVCGTAKKSLAAGAKLSCDHTDVDHKPIKDVCLHCHQEGIGRAKKHPQINFSEHMSDQGPKDAKSVNVCLECHVAHDPSASPDEPADEDDDAKPAEAATPTAAPAAATQTGGAK